MAQFSIISSEGVHKGTFKFCFNPSTPPPSKIKLIFNFRQFLDDLLDNFWSFGMVVVDITGVINVQGWIDNEFKGFYYGNVGGKKNIILEF